MDCLAIIKNTHPDFGKRKIGSLVNVGIYPELDEVFVYSPMSQSEGLNPVALQMTVEEAKKYLEVKRVMKQDQKRHPVEIKTNVKEKVLKALLSEEQNKTELAKLFQK